MKHKYSEDKEKPQKKKGRPNKPEAPIVNEESQLITMSQKTVHNQVVDNMVSSVSDPKVPEFITLNSIQQRWHDVFKNYGKLGFDAINSSWNNMTSSSALNNPFVQNNRVKRISTMPLDLTKEEMQRAMQTPTNHEMTLRGASLGLYYNNYIYQTLIQLNRNVPKYNYYANPLYVETSGEDAADKEKLKADGIKVDKILRKFNPQLTFKTIATQVSVEGKCAYLARLSCSKSDVDFLVLQKLNSDNVKITGFGSKQQFIASFNMTIFLEAGYSVEQYPQFIRDTWESMMSLGIVSEDKKGKKKINPKAKLPAGHILESRPDRVGTYDYWVKLPQDLCYIFYSDGSHPNVFPDTIGLFSDLNDLDDYRWLQGNLLSKGVTSVLTGEVPIIKDPKAGSDATVISPDTILGYQDFFTNNISANVFPFFAPFNDFTLHTLEAEPEALNVIYSRIRDLIATSGNSALLPITDKPSIASVKAAESIQASKSDYLTRQFEQFLNNVINDNFNLKYQWHISLWGDIFFDADDKSQLKELVIGGADGLIPKLLSAHGLTVEDYKGAAAYIKTLGLKLVKEEPKTVSQASSSSSAAKPQQAKKSSGTTTTSSTSSTSKTSDTSEKKVGRPAKKDTEVDNDNTGTSKDAGNNVSSNKK